MLLSLPDDARGWVASAARAARRYVLTQSPAVVVSSGPPHSTHLVAWWATRGTDVPWIADLRDPVTPPTKGWGRESLVYATMVGRTAVRCIERLVMRKAACTVCNTVGLEKTLRDKYPASFTQWLPNAVDLETLPGRQPTRPVRGQGIEIVHAGTLYGDRDPTSILEAIRVLTAKANGEISVRLRIIGQVNAPYDRAIEHMRPLLGPRGHVDVEGVQSRDIALNAVAQAHVTIVLAQGQPLQVPAKLYETAAIAQRALIVTERHSATYTEARRLGMEVIEPGDTDALVAYLTEVATAHAATNPRETVSGLSYEDVALQFSHLLEQLTATNVTSRVPRGEVV